ncbi:MAG: O-antigen ligase [Candidatus Peregrinibacteria bacterium]|nr:O-antigen ligase [Candidatus Peregrinibacteria bacterium]
MKNILKNFKENFSLWALGIFFVVDLFNPLFKKYDYGAEYPLVLGFCVLLAILAVVEYKKMREQVSLEKIFLLIFGLLTILSFSFSQTKNIGFSEVIAFLSVVVLYLIYANQQIDWKEKFLRIVKMSTLIAVIMGFLNYFMLEEVRMFGPFFNILRNGNVWPNAYALFLLMTWPVLLLKSGEKVSHWRNVVIAFTIAALLLTFSRGALLVFGGQLVLLGIYFFRRMDKKKILTAVTVFVAAIAIFFASNYARSFEHKVINVQERVTFGNDESVTSKQERIEFWKAAIQLSIQKPLLGWGPFSFRYAYNPIQKTFLANSDHPHNIFLKITVENGIPAMVCFLAFLITILVTVLKRFKTLDQKSKDMVFILSLAVVGGIMHDMIDYNFNFYANLFLLFIYLIFIRSIVVKKADEGRNNATVIFSVILAVIAIWEVVFLFASHFTHNQKALDYSLYPRDHFQALAKDQYEVKNFQDAAANLDYELKINPLDAEAWYLKSKMDCGEEYILNNASDCETDVLNALKLNPMNEFKYYLEYYKQAFNGKIEVVKSEKNEGMDFSKFLKKTLSLLDIYAGYVNMNVHFTAYTMNVETAAELIDLLAAKSLSNPPLFDKDDLAKIKELQVKKIKMLNKMKELRSQRTF